MPKPNETAETPKESNTAIIEPDITDAIAVETGWVDDPEKEKPTDETPAEGAETPKTEGEEEPAAEEPTAEELKKKEDERLLAAKDEELSDEDKGKKAELVKAQEAAAKAALETEIAAYAKEQNITVDEARSDFEHIAKIREKYKDDQKQLAKANLHLQRLWTKSQDELKAAKDAAAKTPPPELNINNVIAIINEGKATISGKAATREQVIEAYREANPDITMALDDEAVVKLAARDIKSAVESNMREQKAQVALKARDKKVEILNSIPEADKEFVPMVTQLVANLPDEHLVSDKFNVADYIKWAKGDKYDALKSSIEKIKKDEFDRGYAKGKEEAKIIGLKPKDGNAPASVKSKAQTLTEAQKMEALDMFDTPTMTEQQKYEAYYEVEIEPKLKKDKGGK